jgi:hypothetical protein
MKLLLLFVLGSIASLDCANAAGVPIIQKYRVGQKYKQQVTITQESSVSTGVTNSKTKTNLALDLESSVSEMPVDGIKRTVIGVRYAKASMTVEQNGVVSRMESDPAELPGAGVNSSASLAALVGRGYNVVLNESGKVERVGASEQAVSVMAGASPLGAGPYREMFGAAAIARIFEQTQIVTPRGVAPAVGDAWPLLQEMSLPGLGKIVATGTYRLVGTAEYDGKQCSEIAISATIGFEPPSRTVIDLFDNDRFDSLSRQMKLKTDGSTMTGTIYFDPEISFPRGLSMTQMVNIEAKIPDGTKNVIKMPIKQTISVKLADVGPAEDVHPK